MSNFYSLQRNSFGSLANIARYGDNKHSTTIAAYSREDQELLVRSIVAAQKSQLRKEQNSGASNVRSVRKLELNGIAEEVGKYVNLAGIGFALQN